MGIHATRALNKPQPYSTLPNLAGSDPNPYNYLWIIQRYRLSSSNPISSSLIPPDLCHTSTHLHLALDSPSPYYSLAPWQFLLFSTRVFTSSSSPSVLLFTSHCYDYEYGPSLQVTTAFQHTVSVLPVRSPSSLHTFYHARCTPFKDLQLQRSDHVSSSRTTCICSITRNTCLVRSCLSLTSELVLSVLSDKTDLLTLVQSRTIPSHDTLASPGLSRRFETAHSTCIRVSLT